MKRILSFIIVVCTMLSILVLPVSALSESNWAMKYVDFCIDQNLFRDKTRSGITEDQKTKRQEVAYALMKTEGAYWSSNDEPLFSDVAESSYYNGAINWVYANGIMNGTGNGMFSPGVYITKQDLAVAIYRYLLSYSVNKDDFKANNDTLTTSERNAYLSLNYPNDCQSISNYAKNAIYELSLIGLITGNDSGELNPDEDIDLIEAACMLTKAHAYRYNTPNSINIYVRSYTGTGYPNAAVTFLREGSTTSLGDTKDMQVRTAINGIANLTSSDKVQSARYYVNAMSQYTSTFSASAFEESAFYKYITIPQNISDYDLTPSYVRSSLYPHSDSCEEASGSFPQWCPTELIHSGQNFGWRYAYDDNDIPALVFHQAMDYGCYCEQIINTTGYNLIVREVGSHDDRGYYVRVRLGDTQKYLVYEHLNALPSYNVGYVIAPNNAIGVTGNSPGTAYHLHLELKINDILDSSAYSDYFDPRIYFK